MVNLSPTPVFERIKRLEKSGYIKKHTAVLDAEKQSQVIYCFLEHPFKSVLNFVS